MEKLYILNYNHRDLYLQDIAIFDSTNHNMQIMQFKNQKLLSILERY